MKKKKLTLALQSVTRTLLVSRHDTGDVTARHKQCQGATRTMSRRDTTTASNMDRYNSYKDSGEKWLGVIPSHWKVVPFKRIATINNGRDYKTFESQDGFPVIGSGGQFAYASKYMYDGEVVFFGRKGTVDRPLYYNGKFWAVDTMFFCVPNRRIEAKFLYYIGTRFPFDIYKTSTALPSMTQTDLGNIRLCLPPLSEQLTIASYLDAATAKIDAAIAREQKMISLLNERKQIIIYQAVTKGLDPKARMKDSGVEWIGEIPEEWKMTLLRNVSSIKTGRTPSTTNQKYYEGGNINWFTPGDFTDYVLTASQRRITERAIKDNECTLYDAKSVYLIGIGGTIGKVAYCEEAASCNQQVNVIMPRQQYIDYKYLTFFLSATKIQIMRSANLSTLPIINQDKTGNLLVLLPPLSEQVKIVNSINKQVLPLEAAIEKINALISLLQERKQILINAVVTGKVRVC